MQTRPFLTLAAAALALLATTADAQMRRITSVPQPTRQAPAAGVATLGLPNPAGLASPVPAGLTPPTPASLTPPGTPNVASPGTAPGSPAIDAGIAQTYVGGGGGGAVYGAAPVAAAGGTNAMGAAGYARGPLSAVDIARGFLESDLNHDGELSRSEAQRLMLPVPFDELDRNHDGMLSRFEYDDAFR
ncbi:hypothetical protein [Ramlibacter sp. PS4R-6]|uniref:hypothetical protein n=1 Tax=Ramlibacter sp. PS4R-6 TaxID=3133438 RepID=UPI0030A96340